MSYNLKVLKDYPIGFWLLDETSGTSALDSSGCGNNGTYTGSLTTNIFPLIPGGISGSKITNTQYVTLPITKDYYGSSALGGFATKYTSDNDFSLEVWIYPNITTTNITTVFADPLENIGIFWEKGNLVFKLNSERLDYTVEELNVAIHIVCTYSNVGMTMYVNGINVASKSLESFLFNNTSVVLQVGPTANISDYFIVDAPAVYRYALGLDKIKSHFNSVNIISPLQIVEPDGGELFLATDNNIKKPFIYRYPLETSWSEFYDENLYYDQLENYISVVSTDTEVSKSVVLYHQFSIPSESGLISSKAEWYGTEGVTIETSSDGVTYTACDNGRIIPQYKLGTSSFSTTNIVYVKITLSTTDASKYLPKLYNLNFYFYNTKRIYALNGGDYIESIKPLDGTVDDSIWDYDIASISYSPLFRKKDNGIRPNAPGFFIDTLNSIYTVEMMFTPISTAANYLLFSEFDTYFSWNGSGVISKNNISAIYVNGIDRSSATNISSFLTSGETHHIVLVFTSPITSKIWFNVKVLSNVWTDAGPRNLYNYISIYKTSFSLSDSQNHYNLYISKSFTTAVVPSFTVTESSVDVYNKDWRVIKSI
jgi:hypothetical protein